MKRKKDRKLVRKLITRVGYNHLNIETFTEDVTNSIWWFSSYRYIKQSNMEDFYYKFYKSLFRNHYDHYQLIITKEYDDGSKVVIESPIAEVNKKEELY